MDDWQESDNEEVLGMDPITREPLQDPVLASDGVTYSCLALLAAMKADPLHRSPVTLEVLRPTGFRNRVAYEWLRAGAAPGLGPGPGPLPASVQAAAEVMLFQPEQAWPLHSGVPPAAFSVQVTLARHPTAEVLGALLAAGIDPGDGGDGGPSLVLTMLASRDGGGVAWLQHPPPPEEAWDVMEHLGRSLVGKTAFGNPWCVSGARVARGAHYLGTAEELWLRTRLGSAGGLL